MASTETGAVVEVEVLIAAAPETVFDFFVDPDKMIQWMGRSAELDPRPGGRLHCDINGRNVAAGEYLALERPGRVVFTWGWEGQDATTKPGSSTVEVLLEPAGEGTRVRLIHSDLPTVEQRESHGRGWTHYTGRLALAATGVDPGEDPWGSAGEAGEED